MMHPPDETRRDRQEITRRALAEVVRERIAARRLRPGKVSQRAGISRSFLRSILLAEKGCTLFVFLELSTGLGVDHPDDLLCDVLSQRDALRGPRMRNLSQEIATYHRHLPELLAQEGKFVLIKGDKVAGTFDSYQDALTAGYQRFRLDSFLVKQITAAERVTYFRAT